MALSLSDVLTDPAGAAVIIRGSTSLFGVEGCRGRRGIGGSAVFEVTLRPLPILEVAGFPVMHARITVLVGGEVWPFPRHAEGLEFYHRNMTLPRTLCLEWNGDDSAMRWIWEDGFEALVGRVHRHLCWEEQWRRTGKWPVEDAPHGDRVPSQPVTAELKEARRLWRRVS